MPFYSIRCPEGHNDTIFAKIGDRDKPHSCITCGLPVCRVLDAPAVRGEIQAYRSPINGEWINSNAQRKDDLKRSGCLEWEPGIRQDMPRIRADLERKRMAPVEATIDQTVRDLANSGAFNKETS